MHSIIQDKVKKSIIASLSGNVDVNQANAMLSDFKKTVLELNSKDYILIINPENLSTNLFVIPILQSFIKLVSELKFKKIYLINSDKYSALIKHQLGSTDVAETLRFAPSVKEALNNFR